MLVSSTFPANSYNKAQALMDLKRAEADNDDAMGDLRTITDTLRPNEDLGSATQSFLSILNSYGRGATQTVQQAYRQVGSSLRPDENRGHAVDTLLQLNRAEADTSDAAEDYAVVHQSLHPGEDRANATNDFLQLLNLEGRGATKTVHSHFRTINGAVQDETRNDALQTFASLYRAEADADDAIADFQVIGRGRQPGETRASATNDFLTLLNLEGRGATQAVQSHFSLIQSSLRPQENRAGAIETFGALFRAEGDVSDAVSDYKVIAQTLPQGTTRADATGQFLTILNEVGRGDTAQAQQMYRQIVG